ncbi:MAG: LysM peptidoglycan-binding domain-containing protein [Eubacterium sp.]|jgi:LysM repeat protein|nr:LysM peptidoglycan-binding domain-containing protein [Eubacterium sp.]MCI2196545.1 LysM peptidoglycan-binding domain-containing protein [Eubacterium sp.]
MKKVRIVSRVRFTIFILILMAGVLAFTTSAISASGAVKQKLAEHTKYQTIEVQHGDTLWSIASSHAQNNQDIRTCVNQILNINHMKSAGDLKAGQKLRVPDENESSDDAYNNY